MLDICEHPETKRSAILDDLLIRWHHWRQGYRPARGYNGKSLVTGDYVTSRQYDDANGALDDAIENSIMGQIEFEVGELSVIHQSAISAQACALTVGADVFTHPRLPASAQERAKVVSSAREALTQRLLRAGVM